MYLREKTFLPPPHMPSALMFSMSFKYVGYGWCLLSGLVLLADPAYIESCFVAIQEISWLLSIFSFSPGKFPKECTEGFL